MKSGEPEDEERKKNFKISIRSIFFSEHNSKFTVSVSYTADYNMFLISLVFSGNSDNLTREKKVSISIWSDSLVIMIFCLGKNTLDILAKGGGDRESVH